MNQLITENQFKLLLNQKKSALQNFLGDEKRALRFMSAVTYAMNKIPDLYKCTPESLMGAFMECASLNLFPGRGDCDILPYKKGFGDNAEYQAQFQLGYKGAKTLAYRSGVLRCGTEVVYEKDKFKQELGIVQKLVHVPDEGSRGKPVRAYAWAEVTPGAIIFKVMSKDDIMKIKALSKAKDSKYSPWNSGNDPMLWMWQKTAFKQLAKMMPTSDELDRAIYLDNVSERGGYIEAEGEIIEAPFDEAPKTSEEKIEKVNDKKEEMRKAQGIKKPAVAKDATVKAVNNDKQPIKNEQVQTTIE